MDDIKNLPAKHSLGKLVELEGGSPPSSIELKRRIANRHLASRRDAELLSEIQALVEDTVVAIDAPKPEGRILVVVGEPGAGKTKSIDHALRKVPGLFDGPLLCVEAPSPCTLKQLGRNILLQLGYPLRRDLREHITWELVRAQLKSTATRIVWIDEMHHAVTKPRVGELEKVSETLKNVVQQRDWPVSLILSGRESLSYFIGQDRQIERRSRTIRFEPMGWPRDSALIMRMVEVVVESHAGMKAEYLRHESEFAGRLCHAAEGCYGTILAITRQAIYTAHARGDTDRRVLISDFASAYAAERGCSAIENVFLVEKWHEVVPANSRMRNLSTEGK